MKRQIREEKEKERFWHDLKEYNLSLEDSLIMNESEDIRDKADILKKINPGEYLTIATLDSSATDTRQFQIAINRLIDAGFDIGKGDAQYGFKMPLPNKNDIYRKLIIFRRKWNKKLRL